MRRSVSPPALHRPSTSAPDAWARTSIEEKSLVSGNGYLTLFHCHQHQHMDFGLMALFDYEKPA